MKAIFASLILCFVVVWPLIGSDELSGVWDAQSEDIPDIARIYLSSAGHGAYDMSVWSPVIGEDPETGDYKVFLHKLGRTKLIPHPSKGETPEYEAKIAATKPLRASSSGPVAVSMSNYDKTFTVKTEGAALILEVAYHVEGFTKHDRKAVTQMMRRDPLVFRILGRRVRFRMEEQMSFFDNGAPQFGTLYEDISLPVGGRDVPLRVGQIELWEGSSLHWGWLSRDTTFEVKGKSVKVPAGEMVIFDKSGRLTYHGEIPPWAYTDEL